MITKKMRYAAVAAYFSESMPAPKSELNYRSTFELLVAVILSAQCTDKRVNTVTPALFASMPDAHAMAMADIADIFALIRSVSYPNAKAQHLSSMARSLVERHGGQVPDNRANLESLAGVGRKTANVVLSIAFDGNFIAVDTHVFRVANRIGLATKAKTPRAVEEQLTAGFSAIDPSAKTLGVAHHWLILHGRYVCTARAPKCDTCGLSNHCAWHNAPKPRP